jgi:hypothetical protein
MAPELNDLLPIIHALPDDAKEELYAFLGSELKKAPSPDVQPASDAEPFVYDPNNPMLGLFYDAPELADEIVRMAMHDRAHQPWRTPNE